MNYVVYATDGVPLGQFGTGNPPPGVMHIAISDSELDAVRANPGRWCVVGGVLTAYTLPLAQQLLDAQAKQTLLIIAAYQSAIAQPVSYTSAGGVAQTFQADAQAIANLQASINGCDAAQATPAGFYWVALDNTQVPFTYADLKGLAAAIFAQAAPMFAKYQNLKGQIRAATTIAGVQAVVW